MKEDESKLRIATDWLKVVEQMDVHEYEMINFLITTAVNAKVIEIREAVQKIDKVKGVQDFKAQVLELLK